jgi:hypothetical protein
MAAELKNSNGTHVPGAVAIPNGTPVNVVGPCQVAFDASRASSGTLVEVLDGPLKGQFFVVPGGNTTAV